MRKNRIGTVVLRIGLLVSLLVVQVATPMLTPTAKAEEPDQRTKIADVMAKLGLKPIPRAAGWKPPPALVDNWAVGNTRPNERRYTAEGTEAAAFVFADSQEAEAFLIERREDSGVLSSSNLSEEFAVGMDSKAVVGSVGAWHNESGGPGDWTPVYPHGKAEGIVRCGNVVISARSYTYQALDRGKHLDEVKNQNPGVTASEWPQKVKEADRRVLGEQSEAARMALKDWLTKMAASFLANKACESSSATVTCRPPPPITSQQIDRYLDFLAWQLINAKEAPFAPQSLFIGWGFVDEPGYRERREAAYREARSYLSVKDRADIARSVWDQAHGLQKAHIRGEVTLNHDQKQRTKAFGHWADWFEQHARARGAHLYFITPPYPLYGLYGENQVPTPPQLKGEDIFALNTPWGPEYITSDYFGAAMLTLAQGADFWYTKGLLWAAYLAYSEESLAPVVFAGIMNIPYVGPAMTGGLVTYTELNGFYNYLDKGENPLTWDQHIANYSSLINLGLAGYLRTNPNAVRASRTGGIDEGFVGPDVKSRLGGKSFKVLKERSDSAGKKYQTVEYAVVGPLKDNPDNRVSFFTKEFRVVDGPDGPRYFTFDAGGAPKDPIFFLGEKGYHSWSHVTEIKSGHQTPEKFQPLLALFRDRKVYHDELLAIERLMRDPSKSLDTANQRYSGFVNKLIDDSSFTRVNGFYRFKPRQGEPFPAEANHFVLVPTTCGAASPPQSVPVRVSIDPTNGRLMNVFAMEPHNPLKAFVPETKTSVVSSMFAWREIDSRLIGYPPLYQYLPPDLRPQQEVP